MSHEPGELDRTVQAADSEEPEIVPPGLHWKILAGLVVGAVGGTVANLLAGPAGYAAEVDWFSTRVVEPLGRVFLRLIFMIVLPLVVSALVVAVATMGDLRKVGRLGLRTLVYTILLSSIAVALGLWVANAFRPGERISSEKQQQLRAQYQQEADVAEQAAARAKPIDQLLLDLLPENPLQEMVGALDGSSKGNGMLAVMVFSIAIGLAASAAGKRAENLVRWFDAFFYVAMLVVGFAMRIAPFGVACLTFALTARVGYEIFLTLAWYVATVLIGLGIQMFVVYPVVIFLAARRSPLEFFQGASDAIITAFATSSSNATLPVALRVAETGLHLPPSIARFVLTIGATGNQNGTALYEGVTVLFLAQVFGVELTLLQQITVVLMCVLAGVGTAGVPGGSLPLVAVVCRSVGIPPEGIGIILGIDRVLDMCRTTLNVTGDLAIATVVAAGADRQQQTVSPSA